MSNRPVSCPARQLAAVPLVANLAEGGARLVGVRAHRARPERVDVGAPAHLGEVHVAPALVDVSDDRLVGGHLLTALHGRCDVPVREHRAVRSPDRHDASALRARHAVGRGVDGRAVGSRDVHAEVERLDAAHRPSADAGVAEVAAYGMLAVKRLHGPAVCRPPATRRSTALGRCLAYQRAGGRARSTGRRGQRAGLSSRDDRRRRRHCDHRRRDPDSRSSTHRSSLRPRAAVCGPVERGCDGAFAALLQPTCSGCQVRCQ